MLDNVVQIEDKFSPHAKETLAKLITFVEVRFPPRERTSSCTHGVMAIPGRSHPRAESRPSPASRGRGPLGDGHSDHRGVEGQGEGAWVVEFVLEQEAVSEARGAADEP